jgi:energy-coupling factor transport system permease protein
MNPLSKLLFVVIVGMPLLLTLDPVSATVTLALEACVMPFILRGTKVPARRTAILSLAILIGGLTSGLVTLLYANPAGRLWFELGPIHVTDNSIELALATTLRVAALSVPAVLLFATTDITDLADALTQHSPAPERFVIGALAGLRTLQLASTDLLLVRRARRARGVSNSGPLVVIPMLVLSLRRAETLSLAMEARGFDSERQRTHFRTSVVTWRDWFTVGIALTIAAISTYVSVVTGAWHFVIK